MRYAHDWHGADAPALEENAPTAQGAHVAAPGAAANDPGGHSTGSAAPPSHDAPGGHSKPAGDTDPGPQKEPGGVASAHEKQSSSSVDAPSDGP